VFAAASLIFAVSDSDIPQVVDGTLWLLSRAPHIKFPPVTTGVSVQAKLLDHIAEMLKAPNTPKWHYLMIFQILSNLVLHDAGAVAVVESNIPNSVEKFLRSCPPDLYKHIFPMLESLACCESTAMAVVHILPLDLLRTLWRYVFNDLRSSSEVYNLTLSFEDTAPLDPLAGRWERVATKLLDAPRKATADSATCSSFVALVW
jgi:hypothetical protein